MAKVNFDISKRLDITTRKGDSFNLQLTLKDSSGTVLNLYGSDGESKFYMQVRDNMNSTYGNGVILYTVANATGGGGTNPSVDENLISQQLTVTLTDVSGTADADATGIVTISASAADMKLVASGRYVYDLQYEDPGNTIDSAADRKTILYGTFTVNDDITEVLV
tara:strand:- start:269 stop:763 length:495 start_codon:yes stop_codon:yes gene_type:complete